MISSLAGGRGVVLIGLVLVALACFLVLNKKDQNSQPSESPVVEEVAVESLRKSELTGEALAKLELPSEFTEDLSANHLQGYGSPETSVRHDLMLLNDLIRDYISNVKVPGALPTAGNRYIATALLGKNPHRARFLDPSFPFLNANGEILDRWGTPLYFHFEDAESPQLRSAGPDGQMWNEDDAVGGGL